MSPHGALGGPGVSAALPAGLLRAWGDRSPTGFPRIPVAKSAQRSVQVHVPEWPGPQPRPPPQTERPFVLVPCAQPPHVPWTSHATPVETPPRRVDNPPPSVDEHETSKTTTSSGRHERATTTSCVFTLDGHSPSAYRSTGRSHRPSSPTAPAIGRSAHHGEEPPGASATRRHGVAAATAKRQGTWR